jgi:uroporphyrinogen decarboxylase
MSKRERVLAALRGEPVDRPPVSFWFHLGTEDDPPDVVAATELELLETFDLDWLKVMHDYPFGDVNAVKSLETASDLRRIKRVRPNEGGFAKQTEVLQRIGDAVGSDVLFIETIFSPWLIAKILCRPSLADLVRTDAAAVRDAVRIIGESLADYIASVAACGASGIYYAVIAADALAPEYQDTVAELDLELMRQADGAPFNVLHLHGDGVSVSPFTKYPAAALSFRVGADQPAIADVRALYGGALVTGIDDGRTLRAGGADEIRHQIHASLRAAEPRGLLLAPGCAIKHGVTEASLRAVRSAAELYDRR